MMSSISSGASVSAVLRSLLVILIGGLVGVAAVLALTGGWLERLGLTF